MLLTNAKPVRIFDPPAGDLRRATCPDCLEGVVVFTEPGCIPFAVNVDGSLHVYSCIFLQATVGGQVMRMRESETAYDDALLTANSKFCPPFL